jgi:hypothetical protein
MTRPQDRAAKSRIGAGEHFRAGERSSAATSRAPPYELFILAISLLSIVNLVLMAVLPWQSQPGLLVVYIDIALTLVFLIDFAYRFRTAESKRAYLGRGVLDLLSCVPMLRFLRLFRVVRAMRIIRRLGGIRMLGDLRSQLAAGTLYLVVFLGIFVLEVIGLLELHFEEDAVGPTSPRRGMRCGGGTSPPRRSDTAISIRSRWAAESSASSCSRWASGCLRRSRAFSRTHSSRARRSIRRRWAPATSMPPWPISSACSASNNVRRRRYEPA